MHARMMLALSSSAAVLASLTGPASAQNTPPFSIRFPPDGAQVREKVKVSVPLASIPEGAYVAFQINGQFRIALTPTAEQRQKAKSGEMFDFVWDTKTPVKVKGSTREAVPADGPYTIAATLFAPASGTAGGSRTVETSSVRVDLANRITTDPGDLRLRYVYRDGQNRTYKRTGETSLVAGLSQGVQGTGDIELTGQSSELLLAVEDLYDSGNAIVRNKLRKLAVRQSGQESAYPEEMLPKSLYQELDPRGAVKYQSADASFGQFAQLGVPVSVTLDLPILPGQAVRVGDSWETGNVVLDIPGTTPDAQPKVTVKSTLAGLEWEGNLKTARIHQEYSGAPKERTLTFANYVVENPQIKFERDIYVAYDTGVLVKVARKVEVTGKTSQTASTMGTAGGPGGMGMMTGPGGMAGSGGMMAGGPGGMTGPGGMMGMTGPGGMAGMAGSGGMAPPGGMAGMTGPGGMMGGIPGGMTGPGSGGGMPGMGGGRRGNGRMGGMMGPGGMTGPGMGSGGMMGGGRRGGGAGRRGTMGGPMMGGSGMGGSVGSAGSGTTGPTQITLKSTMITELSPTK